MRDAQNMGLKDIPLEEIDDSARLRPVSEAGVAALEQSVKDLGHLKDPIHIRTRRRSADTYRLIAGGHRLAVARKLGWDSIPAIVWDCADDWARMMEIDDNMAGAEMAPLDTAVFLAERKRVYEKIHPSAKRGIAGAVARHATDIVSVAGFAAATAEKFGMNERKVYRLLAAGTALDPKDLQLLREAPQAPTLKDLLDIAKASAPERHAICEGLASGAYRTAARALADHRRATAPESAPRSPAQRALDHLDSAWASAAPSVRLAFAAGHAEELHSLLMRAENAAGDDLTALLDEIEAGEGDDA